MFGKLFKEKIKMESNNTKLNIKLLDGVSLPTYATEDSAGFDLVAHSFKKLFHGKKVVDFEIHCKNAIENGFLFLRPFERVLIGTGIFMEIPKGFELNIRSRSGLALTEGLTVIEGTIDSDYRGEVGIIMCNSTQFPNRVEIGQRVAQAVLSPINQAQFNTVETLSETKRGSGGYGSTGKN